VEGGGGGSPGVLGRIRGLCLPGGGGGGGGLMLIVHCVALGELSLHIHCLSRAHVLSPGLLSLVANIGVIPAFSRPLCLSPLFLSVICL